MHNIQIIKYQSGYIHELKLLRLHTYIHNQTNN